MNLTLSSILKEIYVSNSHFETVKVDNIVFECKTSYTDDGIIFTFNPINSAEKSKIKDEKKTSLDIIRYLSKLFQSCKFTSTKKSMNSGINITLVPTELLKYINNHISG
jgi:hypothetical protein